MADEKKGGDPKKSLQEDKIVGRLMGEAAQPPTGLTSYVGLLYRSSRAGYWMLYLTLDMSLCVEIQEDDIVHSEQLPPDKSPFGSLGGSQVFVRKGAKVTTTRTVSRTTEAGAKDEFDLDIKLGGTRQARQQSFRTQALITCGAACGGGTKVTCFRTCLDTCLTECDTCLDTCNTCQTQCQQATCNTCLTKCGQATCLTCQTCNTQCGQATCQQTCQTCNTQCGQATCQQTCQTCNTQCGQATCQTCDTQCEQATCATCDTCLACPGETELACTHVTCFQPTCQIC